MGYYGVIRHDRATVLTVALLCNVADVEVKEFANRPFEVASST